MKYNYSFKFIVYVASLAAYRMLMLDYAVESTLIVAEAVT